MLLASGESVRVHNRREVMELAAAVLMLLLLGGVMERGVRGDRWLLVVLLPAKR